MAIAWVPHRTISSQATTGEKPLRHPSRTLCRAPGKTYGTSYPGTTECKNNIIIKETPQPDAESVRIQAPSDNCNNLWSFDRKPHKYRRGLSWGATYGALGGMEENEDGMVTPLMAIHKS
jgi:hypothetical protein